MSKRRTNLLLILTALGLLVGLAGGWLLGGHGLPEAEQAEWMASSTKQTIGELVHFPGRIFISILKMLVLPLIVSSMVVGVSALGGINRAGRLGGYTALYYGATTLIATLLGIFLVTTLQPGVGAVLDAKEGAKMAVPSALSEAKPPLQRILEAVEKMFPENLAEAAVDFNVLGLIVFSLVFGLILNGLGERGKTLRDFFTALNDVIMRMIHMVVLLVPIGVACLVANRLGNSAEFFDDLQRLAAYAITVLLGVLIHLLVVLPLIYFIFLRQNPYAFYRRILQAMLTAFGTESSAATLPVTIQCCDDAGISQRTSRFVLPLGATINMDGTALYEAVSVIWIAQMLGVQLGFAEMIIIALTASLAAIGAAAIPSAGLVTMVMVLAAVGLEEAGVGFLGFIYAIDWFLDRFRTATNVAGDAVGAAVLDRLADDLPTTPDPPDPIVQPQ